MDSGSVCWYSRNQKDSLNLVDILVRIHWGIVYHDTRRVGFLDYLVDTDKKADALLLYKLQSLRRCRLRRLVYILG